MLAPAVFQSDQRLEMAEPAEYRSRCNRNGAIPLNCARKRRRLRRFDVLRKEEAPSVIAVDNNLQSRGVSRGVRDIISKPSVADELVRCGRMDINTSDLVIVAGDVAGPRLRTMDSRSGKDEQRGNDHLSPCGRHGH